MNHLVQLALASVVPLVVVSAAVMAASTREPDNPVEEAVHQYLATRGTPTAPSGTGEEVVQAGRPSNFLAAMSGRTYGRGVYFHVSQAFDATFGNSSRAIPYPPRDLWCVAVRDTAVSQALVVFVALHEDMYKAEWILHEPAAEQGTSSLDGWLSGLGCDLGAGR